MRHWFEALWKFLLFSFKPLRHIEAVWGWVGVAIMWLIVIGIIANTSIGIAEEWEHWPIITASLIALLFLIAGVRLQYSLLKARFYIKFWSLHYKRLSPFVEGAPFKGSTGIELTISNQENKPRGIARFML